MAIVTRKTKRGPVYWVVTRNHAERVGFNRRDAERLDAQRKREIKAGTYSPTANTGSTVGGYLKTWLDGRKNRSADLERMMIERHVLGAHKDHPVDRAWFTTLRLDDLRPAHIQRLVEEVKATTNTGKYAANVYGALRSALRAAVRLELLNRDVCLLAPGTLSRKATKERLPYSVDEARAILASAEHQRLIWIALAFYTGMRCGEICGLTWADWDDKAEPLGALSVSKQYAAEPLKTDRPRKAPVHPELAALLRAWRDGGFELIYLRKPAATDYLVPRTDAEREPMTKSAVYKAWRKVLAAAGVANKSVHSTRHTFLTLTRRGGAARDVIERVTHNAEGEMVDHYTHWEWEPLCKAVLCLPSLAAGMSALPDSQTTLFSGSGARTRTSETGAKREETSKSSGTQHPATSDFPRQNPHIDAKLDARQGADYPGLNPAELADCQQIRADLHTALSQRPGLARCSAAAWSLAFAAMRGGRR